MIVGVPRESFPGERRVALVPAAIPNLIKAGLEVVVECPGGTTLTPGADVEARVTVQMPAVDIPGIGAVGEWSWTARHREPVDRYAASP